MKPLETDRLILRSWSLADHDREAFHEILSNERGRRFYASRPGRAKSDELLEGLVAVSHDNAIEWRAVCLKGVSRPMGFSGLAAVDFPAHFTPTVEIGWQFLPAHWGQGYATEAAQEFLRHGFEDHRLPEIVAFAVHNNAPSIAVMKRIGLHEVTDGTFDHPQVPDTHPHLKRHVLWRLTREDWERQQHD